MRRATILLACLCAAGCSKKPATGTDGGAGDTGSASEFAGLSEPPLAYFESHCARCHGPNGSLYGEAFASIAADRDLHEQVLAMVEGPGMGELDDPSMFALVAFHRSLRDGTPFGVVTGMTDDEIRGEMSPGTDVQVVVGTDVIHAEMDETGWQATLPADVGTKSLRVRIMRNGRVFEWDPSEQAWSDAPPPTLEEI